MIKSFQCKETEKVFHKVFSRQLPERIQQTALRKLRMLNSAIHLRDLLSPPNNKLEKLKGERKEQHSIRINDQWRICFKWQENDAHEVEIVDYHH